MGVKIQGLEVVKDKLKGELRSTLDDIESGLPQVLMDAQAEMEVRVTRAHRDINDQAFKPYSQSYARAKQRYQHPGSAGAVSRTAVDMTLTGAMLRAITRSVSRKGSQIEGKMYFSSAKEAEKARGNIDRGRDFFGFTEKQWRGIKEAIANIIKG